MPLKLRKEHLEAFEAQVISLFAIRVIAHLKAVWPAECGELGEPAVKAMVNEGLQRAALLGLSTEYEMVRFIDLSFILVKDFDTNPLSGWIRPILGDRKLTPAAKLERLYQQMENEFAVIEKRRASKV